MHVYMYVCIFLQDFRRHPFLYWALVLLQSKFIVLGTIELQARIYAKVIFNTLLGEQKSKETDKDKIYKIKVKNE